MLHWTDSLQWEHYEWMNEWTDVVHTWVKTLRLYFICNLSSFSNSIALVPSVFVKSLLKWMKPEMAQARMVIILQISWFVPPEDDILEP